MMLHLKWFLIGVMFWALFAYTQFLFAGSSQQDVERFCMHTAQVVEQNVGQGTSLDGLLLHFEQWLRMVPAHERNSCYEAWCAGMTREMIRSGYDENEQVRQIDEVWHAVALQRCLAWARGEVHSN